MDFLSDNEFEFFPEDENTNDHDISIKSLALSTELRIHLFSDGSVFQGEWSDGNMPYRGTCRCINGGVYVGDWKKNKKHGFGIMWYANGSLFVGQFKYDKRHGCGIQIYKNILNHGDNSRIETEYGGIYIGRWKRGKRQGPGEFLYENGSIYEGDWMNGLRHGHGAYRNVNGISYEGIWFNGNKHGYGICDYADGGRYQGEWKNNEKFGRGTHYYADGNVYDGEWQDGKKHGHGVYRYVNGSEFVGEWENGKRCKRLKEQEYNETYAVTNYTSSAITATASGQSSEYLIKNDSLLEDVNGVKEWEGASHNSSLSLNEFDSFVSLLSLNDETTCESPSVTTTLSPKSSNGSTDVYTTNTTMHDNDPEKYRIVCDLHYAPPPTIDKHFRCAREVYEKKRTREAAANVVTEVIRMAHIIRKQGVPIEDNSEFAMAVRWVSALTDAEVINCRDPKTFESLIHALCKLGHVGTIRILLDNPLVNINQRDRQLCTPLTVVAMTNQRLDVAMELVNRGANPILRNNDGLSPIPYAIENRELFNALVAASQWKRW